MKKQLAELFKNAGNYSKAAAGVLGGVIIVVNQATGVVHGSWATGVLAAFTAASVFLVKNQKTIEAVGKDGADLLDR